MNTRIAVILLFFATRWLPSFSQDVEHVVKADPLQISGGVTNSNIWTSTRGKSGLDYSLYLSGNINLNFVSLIDVPVSFAYTNREFTKACSSPFNRLSLAPQYKWIKAYIGYGSMSFSPYTMSGREFMGGGIELTPEGPWKFMAFGGRMQKAVPASEYSDATLKMLGGGLLVGYQSDRFNIAVNLLKAKDVVESLPYEYNDSSYIAPRDNLSGSISGKVSITDNLSFSGEMALSCLNNNTELDSIRGSWLFDDTGDVIKYRAGKASLTYNIPIGSIGVTYERVDPNYTTLGTYYNTNDFENMGLSTQIQITEKVQFSGSVGYRHDNLLKQDVNTNAQIAYAVDLSVTPFETLNMGMSISNMQEYVHVQEIIEAITQTNQYQNLDTLSYTEMNLSAAVNASYQLSKNETFSQSLNGAFSFQRSTHEQEHYTRFIDNELLNTNLAYSIRHVPTSLSGCLALNWNNTRTPESISNVYTANMSASCPIAKVVKLSANVGYSWIRSTVDYNILNARLSASASLFSHHNVNMNLSCVNNTSNSSGDKTQFSANLTYTYSFGCGFKREDGSIKFKTDFK